MTFLAFRGSYVYIYIYNIYITWICVLWSFAEVEYASCGDGPRLTTWIETQSGEDSGSRFVLDVETGPGISTGSDERSDWTGTYPYAEPSGEPVGAIKLLSFRVAWLDCWSWIWPPSFEEVGSALFWNIWNLGLRRKTHTHTGLPIWLGFWGLSKKGCEDIVHSKPFWLPRAWFGSHFLSGIWRWCFCS